MSTMRDDSKILEQLKTLEEKQVSLDCLSALVRGNHFKSVNYVIDTFDGEKLDEAIEATKEASRLVMEDYNGMLDKIKEKKNAPVKVTPPFTWYQDLHRIYIEVKHANRFDVAGCAMLYNETIKITDEKFHVSASCAES